MPVVDAVVHAEGKKEVLAKLGVSKSLSITIEPLLPLSATLETAYGPRDLKAQSSAVKAAGKSSLTVVRPACGAGSAAPPPKRKPLDDEISPEDVRKALELYSGSLIDEVFSAVQDALAEEKDRFKVLQNKASDFLTRSGTSLTLATTLVGGLLHVDQARNEIGRLSASTVILFILAVGSGLLSAGVALGVVLVKGHAVGMNPRALFNQDALHLAQANEVTAYQRERHPANRPEVTPPAAVYRRYLAAEYWEIRRSYFHANETSAKRIKVAQIGFAGFVAFAVAAGVSMGWAPFWQLFKPDGCWGC